jgi:hypothetical protein
MDLAASTKTYIGPAQLLQHSTERILNAYILTLMSAAKGIKLYGQPAVEAVFNEFSQLHDKDVFVPQMNTSLTPAQKKAAL